MQRHPCIIDGTVLPEHISSDFLGDKAYRLLELSWIARQLGSFKVPKFSLVRSSVVADYYQQKGYLPSIDYSPLMRASEIPVSALDYFKDLSSVGASIFQECIDQLSTVSQLYIGSSVVVDPENHLSFAGVNSRTEPIAQPLKSPI